MHRVLTLQSWFYPPCLSLSESLPWLVHNHRTLCHRNATISEAPQTCSTHKKHTYVLTVGQWLKNVDKNVSTKTKYSNKKSKFKITLCVLGNTKSKISQGQRSTACIPRHTQMEPTKTIHCFVTSVARRLGTWWLPFYFIFTQSHPVWFL